MFYSQLLVSLSHNSLTRRSPCFLSYVNIFKSGALEKVVDRYANQSKIPAPCASFPDILSERCWPFVDLELSPLFLDLGKKTPTSRFPPPPVFVG